MPDHVGLEGKAYTQTKPDYDMRVEAWCGTVGYIWDSLPWSPRVSCRHASFSGDDPNTENLPAGVAGTLSKDEVTDTT
jgi:hypothetical protein